MGSGSSIVALFPPQYSKLLLPFELTLYCSSDPASTCAVQENRRVVFSSFVKDVSAIDTVSLSIFGIMNPASGKTDHMVFYVISQKLAMSYLELGGFFTILAPPQSLDFTMVNATDPRAGATSNYQFKFNSGQFELPGNGTLWVDWPDIYRERFTAIQYVCSSSLRPGEEATCRWLRETGLKRTQVTNAGLFTPNTANILLTLKAIPNPKVAGVTDPFILRLADLSTNSVLAKSYNNLNKNTTVTIIGDSTNLDIQALDQAAVTRGTFSSSFTVKLGLPSYNPLTISPTMQGLGFTFSPAELKFQFAWNSTAQFNVGAALSVPAGTYVMSFTKSEVGTNRYSSLSDMQLIVTDPAKALRAVVGNLPDLTPEVPSLPIFITLDRAVVDGMYVNIATVDPVQKTEVQISPEIVAFNHSEMVRNFTITVSSKAVPGFITYEIFGESAGAYQLTKTRVPLSIFPLPKKTPSILHFRVQATDRTSSSLRATLNSPGKVSYLISFKGTVQPTPSQIVSATQIPNSAPQFFGSVYTSASLYTADISTTMLRDETWYVAYAVAQSTTGALSTKVASVEFKTAASYKPVSFRITTKILVQVSRVILAVAQTLGIPEFLISLIGADPAIYYGQGRRLQSEAIIYELAMSMDRSQDANPPIRYVLLLDSRIDLLQNNLPELDSSKSISATAKEFQYSAPDWSQAANLTSANFTSASISAAINSAGTIYAVLLPASEPRPLAQQIALGFDSYNVHLPSAFAVSQSCQYKTPIEMRFENLTQGELYVAWVVGENDLPGTPTLMIDGLVTGVNFTAGTTTVVTKGKLIMLGDEVGSWLLLSALALVLACF